MSATRRPLGPDTGGLAATGGASILATIGGGSTAGATIAWSALPMSETSHSFTDAPSVEAIVRPSGEKATDNTRSERPPYVRSSRPFETSQILTVRSELPETIVRPSGENAIELTPSAWPVSVNSSRPLEMSQSLIVLSQLPAAI